MGEMREMRAPKESKKEVKSLLRWKVWRRCVQDCNHKEREDNKECGYKCCLPHPHWDREVAHTCKAHCKGPTPDVQR